MPSQHEIEERIKLEIGKKIDAGDFKTTKDPNSKSAIWKVFASITNEYGQIFNGYIYCTKCGKVFRYDGQRYSIALYKHECLAGEEQTQSCRKTDEMPEDLMKEKMEDILIPVWQMFDLTFMEGERTVEARITCRQCNIQLDYDYNASNVTQQKIHKCLDLGER